VVERRPEGLGVCVKRLAVALVDCCGEDAHSASGHDHSTPMLRVLADNGMVNQRILDALRMGDPHLAEQTVVHITGLFLKAALAVWPSR